MFFEVIDKNERDRFIFNKRFLYGLEFYNSNVKLKFIDLDQEWELILDELYEEEYYTYIFNNVPRKVIHTLLNIYNRTSFDRLENKIIKVPNKIFFRDFQNDIKRVKGSFSRAIKEEDFVIIKLRTITDLALEVDEVVAVEVIKNNKIIIQIEDNAIDQEKDHCSYLIEFKHEENLKDFIYKNFRSLISDVLVINKNYDIIKGE